MKLQHREKGVLSDWLLALCISMPSCLLRIALASCLRFFGALPRLGFWGKVCGHCAVLSSLLDFIDSFAFPRSSHTLLFFPRAAFSISPVD